MSMARQRVIRAGTTVLAVLAAAVAVMAPPARGAPGDGLAFGKFMFRPSLDTDLTYDTNPYMRANPDAGTESGTDVSTVAGAGPGEAEEAGGPGWVRRHRLALDGQRRFGSLAATGRLWGMTVDYANGPGDTVDFGEDLSLGLSMGGGTEWSAQHGYSVSHEDEDYLSDRLGKIERYVENVAVERPFGERVTGNLSVNMLETKYEIEEGHDWAQLSLGYGLGYRAGEFVELRSYGTISLMSTAGTNADQRIYSLDLGAVRTGTERLHLELSGGIRVLDDGVNPMQARPSAVGTMGWQATERLLVVGDVNTRVAPAVEFKDTFVYSIGSGLRVHHLIGDGMRLTFGVARVQNDYIAPVPLRELESARQRYESDLPAEAALAAVEDDDRTVMPEDEVVNTLAEWSYTIPKEFMTVYVRCERIMKDSDINSYDRDRFGIGLSLMY